MTRRLTHGAKTGLEHCRALVMGLGRFGGGVGAVRWLARQGARVHVVDALAADRLKPSIDALSALIETGSVTTRFGPHERADFERCDLLVVNPAIPRPWENPFIQAARAGGARISTEIELLLNQLRNPERLIGVSGSAGKSTTAAMIAHILRDSGRITHLGGNIGGSLLDHVETMRDDDAVVLELSSFMLHWIAARDRPPQCWPPHVGVLTSYAPNHLDWHADEAHYKQSKAALFDSMTEANVIIAPDAGVVEALGVQSRASQCFPDQSLKQSIELAPLLLPGAHNRANAALATAACRAFAGVDAGQAVRSVRRFEGLPHRLQRIGVYALTPGREPVQVFDDSKSTTPDATRLAVDAFDDPAGPGAARVRLIAGGFDKGVDLSPIAEQARRVAGMYLIGATAEPIANLAGRSVNVSLCGAMDRACAQIRRDVGPGEVILLSPGCASWDQFEHFEQRGESFAREIRRVFDMSQKESEQS